MNQINAAKQRLFFALWPGDSVRSQLGEVSRQWTRRPIAEEKLHMTLVFLGDRDAEQRQCFVTRLRVLKPSRSYCSSITSGPGQDRASSGWAAVNPVKRCCNWCAS